jgi:hypothetical protein
MLRIQLRCTSAAQPLRIRCASAATIFEGLKPLYSTVQLARGRRINIITHLTCSRRDMTV